METGVVLAAPRRTWSMYIVAAALTLAATHDAYAQRGSQHLNSPGYQRALQESRRKPTQQQLDQLEIERRALQQRKHRRR